MKLTDKIKELKNNHFSEWMKMRQAVDDELSSKQSLFCVCGKLATGLHESNCRKYNLLVDKETAKRC